jgi:UDP-N-acetylmuramoyl-L-alanyl-D-glutamate--2,6-diaminopimelate ligase
MTLAELLAELDRSAGDPPPQVISTSGDLSTAISSIEHDSRQVAPGALFCCVRGANVDGHDFAGAAVAAGAVALVVDHALDVDAPQVVVADVRAALGPLAAAVAGRPSRALSVVGITGTNGKTTVTYLLQAIFDAAGEPAAVLGTLSGARTTPEAPELQRWLAEQRDRGVRFVAMEVSSHALVMQRVRGTRYAVAVFTNLTRDHLDFHASMEEYFAAKAELFRSEYAERAVVNADSPHGRILADTAEVPTVTYSVDDVVDLSVGAAASSFTWRGERVELALGGRFNVSNALAAAETAVALGFAPATVAAGLSRPIVIPGRFQVVDEGQPFSVVVDFAHTPDGLEQLLRSAREVIDPARRVHVVFGCGGDRDATKRAPMGEVAARLADRVVLTADNSRGEPTGDIIAAIRQGFDTAPERRAGDLVIEPDRRRAIDVTLAGAEPGDIVLVAGKGHERTQTIGDTVVPFDDVAVVSELLRAAS